MMRSRFVAAAVALLVVLAALALGAVAEGEAPEAAGGGGVILNNANKITHIQGAQPSASSSSGEGEGEGDDSAADEASGEGEGEGEGEDGAGEGEGEGSGEDESSGDESSDADESSDSEDGAPATAQRQANVLSATPPPTRLSTALSAAQAAKKNENALDATAGCTSKSQIDLSKSNLFCADGKELRGPNGKMPTGPGRLKTVWCPHNEGVCCSRDSSPFYCCPKGHKCVKQCGYFVCDRPRCVKA